MMFYETFTSEHRGALYSTNKKIPELPISGQELNARDFFRNKYFGILGIPCEIVLTFREIGTTGKFRSYWPFLLGFSLPDVS